MVLVVTKNLERASGATEGSGIEKASKVGNDPVACDGDGEAEAPGVRVKATTEGEA